MNKILLVLVTVLHLIPHPFGVSPIGATALYGGAYAHRRIVWIVPLIPLLLGDLIGGFYNITVMIFVYAGFALSSVIGRVVLAPRRNIRRYAVAIGAAALIFFLVSNFAVWLVGMYPPTIAGLLQCYINGLPYLGTALLADAVFCFVLFGLHSKLADRPMPATV